ncbi:acylphosphatase [Candidatus Woesearchaeota archaeon]|nr:acylphosphatase [Candidatus Woesearchaeota archaeon]
MKQVHLIITGRVQGVSFRYSTKQKAQDLGITGWVRNIPNNAVEVVAEGYEETLQQFIVWCHKGSLLANVTSVKVTEKQYTGKFTSFDIRYL